jgi:hypothetical protein
MKSQLFIFLFVLFFNGKAEKDGAKSLRYPKPWLEPKVHLLLKEIAQMANSSRETANTNSSDGIPAMDIQWIVDVNARRGQSSGAFGQLFPHANLLIIEPNKNHKWALMVCIRPLFTLQLVS